MEGQLGRLAMNFSGNIPGRRNGVRRGFQGRTLEQISQVELLHANKLDADDLAARIQIERDDRPLGIMPQRPHDLGVLEPDISGGGFGVNLDGRRRFAPDHQNFCVSSLHLPQTNR